MDPRSRDLVDDEKKRPDPRCKALKGVEKKPDNENNVNMGSNCDDEEMDEAEAIMLVARLREDTNT